jgi:aminoglycoside phosphotransferase (APT) family kinase protein
LRAATDESLGIDESFLREAMTAFGLSTAASPRRAFRGTFHRLYEVEGGRLLRVATSRSDIAAEAMRLECEVMTTLRPSGFPIPACDARTVGGRGVQLVERAAGNSLTAFDDDEARMQVALEWVGRLLARLHRIGGNGFGPLSAQGALFRGVHPRWDDYVFTRLEEHVASCQAIGAIDASEGGAIRAHFEAQREAIRAVRPSLLHGDPGSHNFMVDERGICAVIDWEDALVGDPLFEMASLATFHPERRHDAIWSGYGTSLARGSAEWQRFWLYFLRIALAKTVHRHRFGYADVAGRPPASRRIQLALERLGWGT